MFQIAALLLIAAQSAGGSDGDVGASNGVRQSGVVGGIGHRVDGGGAHDRRSLPVGAPLSRAEQKAIRKLQQALAAKDYPAAETALQAARRAAKFNEGRYAVSVLQLQLGSATGNAAMQIEAIDAALETGMVPKTATAELSALRGQLAAAPARSN